MVTLRIGVAEFELLALDIDHLDFFGGSIADVGGLSRIDVADDGLHEGAQVARGAMLNFKDDGDVSVVTDGHAFTEIVCECH